MKEFDFLEDFIPEAMKEHIKDVLVAESKAVFQDCCKSGVFESMRKAKALLNSGRTRETKLFLCNAKTRHELLSAFSLMVNVPNVEFVVYDFIKDGEVFEVTDEKAKQSMLQAHVRSWKQQIAKDGEKNDGSLF